MSKLLETAKENLSFLLTCILIALALVAVARIAEHFLPPKRKVSPTRRINLIAICSASQDGTQRIWDKGYAG